MDLGLWDGISYSIVKSLYGTCMRIYDVLIELSTDTNVLNTVDIMANLYVLAGVFMLFRVIIAMIQMVINPDLVNDKQAGAGKMISRIVVSIVMLLLFSPTGLIFNYNDANPEENGILARLESALIQDEGSILYNITATVDDAEVNDTEETDENGRTIVNIGMIFPYQKYLLEDVYAGKDSSGNTVCYFYKKSTTTSIKGSGNDQITTYDPVKITFSSSKLNSSSIKVTNTDGFNLYATLSKSEPAVDGEGKTYEFQYETNISSLKGKKNGTIFSGKLTTAPTSTTCKNWHLWDSDQGWHLVYDKKLNKDRKERYYVGYNKFNQMVNTIKDDYKNFDEKDYSASSVSKIDGISKKVIDYNKEHYAKGYSEESIAFGTALIGSFQECNARGEKEHKDCINAKQNQFETSNNKEIVELIKDEKIDFSFMIALIVGIVVIVYLVILCVEVVIRGFKLMLLKIIAPIPIISYVDPKDKIFDKWSKMFIATYLDLFIKIFAIHIGVLLISRITDPALTLFDGNLFKKFLVLVGILIFVKIIPSMLTKLFGLDNMGGSFKDIMGMGKAALGFGAGAAIGGAVGAASGTGLGRVTGLGKGMLMGAGAGSKGKIMKGANSISAQNARINDAKKNGLGFWDRTVAGMAGTVGYSPKTVMDNRIKDKVAKKGMLDDWRKHKDNIENMAEKYTPIADLKQEMIAGRVSKDEFKKVRKNFIKAAEKGDDSFAYSYKDVNGNLISKTHQIGDGDRSKVNSAIEIMKSTYDSNSFLRTELNNAYAEQQKARFANELGIDVSELTSAQIQEKGGIKEMDVTDYATYETSEGVATFGSNKYNREITEFQQSDPYRKAKSIDDYSKKK